MTHTIESLKQQYEFNIERSRDLKQENLLIIWELLKSSNYDRTRVGALIVDHAQRCHDHAEASRAFARAVVEFVCSVSPIELTPHRQFLSSLRLDRGGGLH